MSNSGHRDTAGPILVPCSNRQSEPQGVLWWEERPGDEPGESSAGAGSAR